MEENRLTVVARIKAKADKIPQVSDELRKLVAPSRAAAGCINFDMHLWHRVG